MRLLGLVPLVFVLAACGGSNEAAPTPSATTAVTPDSELAKAAEGLANQSDSPSPSGMPTAPMVPSGEAQMTISARPSKYDVKAPLDDRSDDCDHIWQPRNVLPSPYNGCMDGQKLIAAEGKQGDSGVYFRYNRLCGREGRLITAC